MTRISTFQQNQSLINEMLKAQNNVASAQRQVSTGHKAEYYKDIHMDVSSLAGSKSLLARLEQHAANNGKVMNRLAHYDQSLSGMEKAGGDLRGAVMSAISSSSPQGLLSTIEGAFESVQNFLNARNT